jgi:putative pyruvate formate lyase activating enzyme
MDRPDTYMADCVLCPRMCHANRTAGHTGYCGESAQLVVARAALHPWEEECISGENGSGTVFFSGCNMGCIFCQNYNISRAKSGKAITVERLSEIFLELQGQRANNINLVTPTHYVPQIIEALDLAKKAGLCLPVVYNSSGYEKVETLRLLRGYVDIYLPDFKYMDERLAGAYSRAPDYPAYAKQALEEMVSQTGEFRMDEGAGLLKSGVVVRHLALPGHVRDSKEVIRYLHETYGNRILLSIMNQYTPMPQVKDHTLLGRKLTKREYGKVVDYALGIGVECGYIQEGEAAKQSFIPEFDGKGV